MKINKTKISVVIVSALVIGLVFSSPLTMLTNVNAQVQSTPSTSGMNIILDKPSSTQVPVQKQLRDELMSELKTTQSESSKNAINSELGKIDASVLKWFQDRADPLKEKLVREKQQILENALMTGGINLPWSAIGYDYVDHALELGIIPQDFTSDKTSAYFVAIRSIVGDQINVSLSPQQYSIPDTCTGYRVACTPMEGGIQIQNANTTDWGSIMYAATYNGQKGFMSAGHFGNAGDNVKQPNSGSVIGKVKKSTWINGTNCDCSFSANTTRNISKQVHGYTPTPNNTAPPFVGMSVTLCGAGSQGCISGSVTSTGNTVKYSPSNIIVKDLIGSSYSSVGGDSGAPVISGTALVGVHSGLGTSAWSQPVADVASNFSGLTWCFTC